MYERVCVQHKEVQVVVDSHACLLASCLFVKEGLQPNECMYTRPTDLWSFDQEHTGMNKTRLNVEQIFSFFTPTFFDALSSVCRDVT